MSLKKVAQLAGVSAATVSKVVNDHPRVAPATVASVRRAMKQLRVSARPCMRQRARFDVAGSDCGIAFLVFGTAGHSPAPAFKRLLNGVSAAAAQHDLSLMFSFVSDAQQLPPRLAERKIAGLLLHGEQLGPAVEGRLRALPTVWLMANRERPEWGDQVLPDNSAIGEMAAQHLIRRGHRRLAYLAMDCGRWGMQVRSFAFARAADAAGARADIFQTSEAPRRDLWSSEGLLQAGRELVERVLAAKDRPTGLFVSEDRLLPGIDAALSARGITDLRQGGIELVSCNNERPHLARLQNLPSAEIDIRVESIARRGVEQLVWRLRNPNASPERIRAMVEPALLDLGSGRQPVESRTP